MKQPQRLMRTGSPQARALLASLDEDVPPDPVRGQEQVLRALHVTASAPGSAPDPRVAGSRRWVPLAFTAGVIFTCVIATAVSKQDAAPPAKAPVQVAEGPAAAPNANAPIAPAVSTAPETAIVEAPRGVDVHALTTAPPPPAERVERVEPNGVRGARTSARRDPGVAAKVATPAPAEAAHEVTDELQLLERAQAAASRGRGDDALALVAAHRRDFPRGRFTVEMSVVEIEALASAGRVEEAATRGARFLETHPGSPYTRRVEAVVRLRARKEQP